MGPCIYKNKKTVLTNMVVKIAKGGGGSQHFWWELFKFNLQDWRWDTYIIYWLYLKTFAGDPVRSQNTSVWPCRTTTSPAQ